MLDSTPPLAVATALSRLVSASDRSSKVRFSTTAPFMLTVRPASALLTEKLTKSCYAGWDEGVLTVDGGMSLGEKATLVITG